ncbi:threonine--tRNA ligase, partial [Vitellibacter sp. q18]|nr:threonine--tRNA ligase [Aequorivita lutea]
GTFHEDELQHIEAEMHHIIKENLPIIRKTISYEKAVELFTERNEPFKLEILEHLSKHETITIYRQGEFVDLCRGPHLPSTGCVKAFQLSHVSGAYWRGNSDSDMLQRIYGFAFKKQG